MSNKKFLQSIAALLILIFHLWMPITSGPIEAFIVKTGYIGVDLFFFVSAYSLADKEIKYSELLKNRFLTIYVKFLLLIVAAAIIKGMPLIKMIKAATMVDFFEKGGGAFLWFVPAIFIFYLIYPLFIQWNNRYKIVIVLVFWLLISVAIELFTGYNKIFIFTNRIPVIMLGFFMKKKNLSHVLQIICIPVGIILLYLFGYKSKLNSPITEMFYVVAIILVIGIAGISSYVSSGKLWDILSCGTLEMYGLQMIIGPRLVTFIYRTIGNRLATNLIVIVVIFTLSFCISKIYAYILSLILREA